MLNNIDKKLEAIGNNEETKRLADLEKIEFDVMQNLADYFEFGKTVASLTDAEKQVVNDMLRMSLGKDK